MLEWRHCQPSCTNIEKSLNCLIEVDFLHIWRILTILIFITIFIIIIVRLVLFFLPRVRATTGRALILRHIRRTTVFNILTFTSSLGLVLMVSWPRNHLLPCALRDLSYHIFERLFLLLNRLAALIVLRDGAGW